MEDIRPEILSEMLRLFRDTRLTNAQAVTAVEMVGATDAERGVLAQILAQQSADNLVEAGAAAPHSHDVSILDRSIRQWQAIVCAYHFVLARWSFTITEPDRRVSDALKVLPADDVATVVRILSAVDLIDGAE